MAKAKTGARAFAGALMTALSPHADPARARSAQAYLKHDLVHIGVTVPAMRAAVKEVSKTNPLAGRAEVVGAAIELWASPPFERRSAAVAILCGRAKELTMEDVPVIERFLREARTWALLDELAEKGAGSLAAREERMGAVLDRWSKDEDFWLRRASMLALLGPIRKGAGDFDRFSRYADAMLHEKEFFIRKAIGWILRETSKKRPDLVAAWMLERRDRASGVTTREAVKYLSDAQRAAIVTTRRRAREA